MKTILLVDDSVTMLKSLQTALEISGFRVATAVDGVSALKHIEGGLRPDLVITDINMPNMDGLTFIKHARQHLRFTPILALTTEGQRAKRDEAKQLGATGWILKPAIGSDLLKTIQHVMPALAA
jgi:two-component system, chemotaxis family, chemotaxis protein CheY